ncbi:octanoyltransferase [Pigmentiphaga sp. NML080357]|uniref:lipoyl(octanoyl) transferase LipB n=1 Tax=Pigmentiphaga sp. NML080357 TaxID=2008675 RepID=UPI000B41046C|nr:lipoyl(octanoyl) transferase LipB [Pigmentiphaga sp. NML080357]OVZ59298.1 octanoyltransferase [Pigmentiphaga sp. NML080357]
MLIRWLPRPAEYQATWDAMKAFTAARGPDTPDEIWLVEHGPVFTLGQAGKPEHVLAPHDVPVVKSDRGGQVTYHGPGQVVAYVLLDLKRAGYFVKEYVVRVEQAVIDLLADLGLPDARRKPGAPGVYVDWPRSPASPEVSELAKISALGIKVHRGCTYHGVALNVAMDLSPFGWINPCGYVGLRTVDLASCGCKIGLEEAGNLLARYLERGLAAGSPAGALADPAPAAVE